MEGAIVINFTHLLFAGAVFGAIFFGIRWARVESYKRQVKNSEMQAQLAEDRLYTQQNEFEEYKIGALRAVKRAKLESELAQMKADGVDGRIQEERDTSKVIYERLTNAVDRDNQAFSTILEQQTTNSALLGDTIVRAVKHASKGSIVERHYGLDKDEDE